MPFGPWEIAIILVILVLIFGASRLSQVGGAVGKSVREFRTAVDEEPAPAPAPVATVPPVACPTCQAPNSPSNKFCSTCGATMIAAPAAAVGTSPVAGLAAVVEPSALDKPHTDEPDSELAAIDRPSAAPKIAETTCPSCATINPPGQPFCGQCGTRLTSAAA